MVTVAEIARNIGIPATTAREYVGRFKPFFPTKKVTGKRYPMHPETAELIMRDIVDSYAKNMTTDDITNLLKDKYAMNADIVDETKTETNNHPSSNSKSLSTDNATLEIISRMSNMQMQLMQKMTEVLDRNNEVMERVIDALDKNGSRKRQDQLSASLDQPKTPPPPPKKFIMPTKEEMEKRNQKSWLGRMFGAKA